MKAVSYFAAAAILAAALTGCASLGTSVSTTPASVGAGATQKAPTAAQQAHVGSSIVLKGQNAGDQLTVTLVAVAPTTKSTNEFAVPKDGYRYFAAQFRLTNSGSGAYDDSPSNGAKAIDSTGQQFDATFADTIAAGPVLPSDAKVAPGGAALGWLVFEVPAASKITAVQFSLSSGFGNTGEWKIP